MAEKFILAHDLGTTGNKVSLFDEQGQVRASSLSIYGTEYPRPNWVEQNPEDWWKAVCASTKELLSTAGGQLQQWLLGLVNSPDHRLAGAQKTAEYLAENVSQTVVKILAGFHPA